MSKKDKNRYSPRHVNKKENPASETEYRPQVTSRPIKEEQMLTNNEFSNELWSDRKLMMQHRQSLENAEKQASSQAATDAAQAAAAVSALHDESNNNREETKENTTIADKAEPTITADTEQAAAGEPSAEEQSAAKAPLFDDAEIDAVEIAVAPAKEASPEDLEREYGEVQPEATQKEGDKPRKKKKWKAVLIAVIAIPLAIIIAGIGAFFVMREIGRRNMQDTQKVEMALPTVDESNNQIVMGDRYGRIITYNGVSYVYNNDIVALTFIGVDDGHGADKELRMADAIYVLAINSKTGKVKLLNISRDIMTDVDVYSKEGNFIDTENIQIAYSNAYFGQGITGGDNTNRSISRLMFGLPMENYIELNLGAVKTLNDAVGGVTVTSKLTFTSPVDGRTINEGEKVTLHGEEAEYYTRRRDTKVLESNNDRMQRQQDYIMSFLGSIIPVAKSNPSIIPELYSAIKQNTETSLKASELIYLASSAVANLHSISDIEFVKFDGKITEGINAEMRVTDEEVLTKMLDIFYEPLNNTLPTDEAGNPIAPPASPTEIPPTAPPTAAPATEAPAATTASAQQPQIEVVPEATQAAPAG